MFVALSCELPPSLFKLCLCGPKLPPQWMSHVLLIEGQHPVSFVNITYVKT